MIVFITMEFCCCLISFRDSHCFVLCSYFHFDTLIIASYLSHSTLSVPGVHPLARRLRSRPRSIPASHRSPTLVQAPTRTHPSTQPLQNLHPHLIRRGRRLSGVLSCVVCVVGVAAAGLSMGRGEDGVYRGFAAILWENLVGACARASACF